MEEWAPLVLSETRHIDVSGLSRYHPLTVHHDAGRLCVMEPRLVTTSYHNSRVNIFIRANEAFELRVLNRSRPLVVSDSRCQITCGSSTYVLVPENGGISRDGSVVVLRIPEMQTYDLELGLMDIVSRWGEVRGHYRFETFVNGRPRVVLAGYVYRKTLNDPDIDLVEIG